jgi:hypothetical protein
MMWMITKAAGSGDCKINRAPYQADGAKADGGRDLPSAALPFLSRLHEIRSQRTQMQPDDPEEHQSPDGTASGTRQ